MERTPANRKSSDTAEGLSVLSRLESRVQSVYDYARAHKVRNVCVPLPVLRLLLKELRTIGDDNEPWQ